MVRVAMLSMHTSPLAPLGSGDGGGMNVYVKELAARLPNVDVAVDIYTATERPQPALVDLRTGLRIHYIAVGTGTEPEVQQRFTAGVTQHIERNGGVDLVHAHYWKSGVTGHQLKHHFDVPLVTTFHTLSRVKQAAGIAEVNGQRADAEAAVIGCSDAIIANDNREAAELHDYYDIDTDSQKVRVIAPGVDLSHFQPRSRVDSRVALGLPLDQPIVLLVGRVQPIKGFDIAMTAVDEVRRTHPEARIVLVGGPSGVDGDQAMRALRRQSSELGLEALFVGPQNSHVMSQWYNAADVCMVPSRSESFGLVALEASACGTPVIASDVGALPSVVLDGQTGYIVPPARPRALARATNELLGNADLRDRFGLAATKHARAFSWDATVGRTYCLYNRVLDNALLAGVQPATCLTH